MLGCSLVGWFCCELCGRMLVARVHCAARSDELVAIGQIEIGVASGARSRARAEFAENERAPGAEHGRLGYRAATNKFVHHLFSFARGVLKF